MKAEIDAPVPAAAPGHCHGPEVIALDGTSRSVGSEALTHCSEGYARLT